MDEYYPSLTEEQLLIELKNVIFGNGKEKDVEYVLRIADEKGIDLTNMYFSEGLFQNTTPLMIAIIRNNIHIVKILFDRGADLEKIDVVGRTVEQIATSYGNLDVSNFIREYRNEQNSIKPAK